MVRFYYALSLTHCWFNLFAGGGGGGGGGDEEEEKEEEEEVEEAPPAVDMFGGDEGGDY